MTPFMAVKQLFRDIRKQKLRTMMTMFGIMWGTLSVILLMGFGAGLHRSQIERFKGLGENIAMFWPGLTSKPWQGLPRGRRVYFSEEDIARIKATFSSIERISPEYRRWSVPMKTARTTNLTYVAGVWPEFATMRNVIPQMGGRFLNAMDLAEKRRVVFLGNDLAETLFGSDDPVGNRLLINNVPFTVIGVLKPKLQNSSYSGRDSHHAWIPSTTFMTMWSYRYPNMMIVQAPLPQTMPRIKREIYGFLADKYNFDPNDTETLMVWDTTEGLKTFHTFFMAFRIFLVAIGCMTLVTGGIGVTNIMNVVIEERTKEIGVKMAVGAKKITILFQFLLETLFLTAIGGALGFGLATLIIELFPADWGQYLGVPILNVTGALFSILILGVIALISGFFPARRAANLEPVKALKLF
jgi:putative ABC transport system permease protein